MNYICLKHQQFIYQQHQLLPIREQDMPLIKEWRNAQIALLRQPQPLTDEMQKRYYRETLLPSFTHLQPAQLLFSFLNEGKVIGYGGLVHIDWNARRAEISFLCETERSQKADSYREAFALFLHMIKEIAFQELKFHRLFTETFDIRPLHVAILEANGFVFEGRLREHVIVENRFVDALMHGCLTQETESRMNFDGCVEK